MASWAGNPPFDLSQLLEEHQGLRTRIRALSEKEIAPHAADVDVNPRFPEEARQALVASGFNAVHVPEQFGGQGADSVAACAAQGAIQQRTMALALEWSREGIRVNGIGAVWFSTEEPNEESQRELLVRYLPWRRKGAPGARAGMVV